MAIAGQQMTGLARNHSRSFRSRDLLERLARSTLRDEDQGDESVAQATLTLGTWVITALTSVWVVAYLVLGRPLSAAIPFAYQVLSIATLAGLRRGSISLSLIRGIQLSVMLALPFLLQASLGGFVGSGGVAAWALCTPVLAFLYGSSPSRWLAGFAGLSVVAAVTETFLADTFEPLVEGPRSVFFAFNLIGLGLVIHSGISYSLAERERRRVQLAEANRRAEAERERADELLASIMPIGIARRLKAGESRIADRIPAATVLAADIAGFTELANGMSPPELVDVVDELWTRFDRLVDSLGLEKIKSVGDSYIVLGGLDPLGGDQLNEVLDLALAMCRPHHVTDVGEVQIRVGVASGPVVAGVIGEVRPTFGLWGDAVNTASRMESTGVPGRVQVTEPVWERAKHRFESEVRGKVLVKGKGSMQTYLLVDNSIE